jgi:hypothetical protein
VSPAEAMDCSEKQQETSSGSLRMIPFQSWQTTAILCCDIRRSGPDLRSFCSRNRRKTMPASPGTFVVTENRRNLKVFYFRWTVLSAFRRFVGFLSISVNTTST